MQYLLGAVVVALLVVGGWFFFQSSPVEDQMNGDEIEVDLDEFMGEEPSNSDETEGNEVTDEVTDETMDETSNVVEIDLSAENFAFSQDEIRVNEGDTVRVTFSSTEGTHDFVIDEFATRSNMLNAGENEVVEFIADTAGTYEYYCSVGSHREMGMVGTLIVE